ncbi:uncharacterized protein V6R79_011680 [Siganus canaliculatus]
MTPDTDESVRCSASSCSCLSFKPGSAQLRSCDRCGHSWVTHALEKLRLQQQQRPSSCSPVEVALPGLVFDLSSLVLYGTQAVPVRLKILLDRLYSVLTPDQVGHILRTLGWSLGDYVRGYMLQLPGGSVLDRWSMASPDEERLILQQFLRFGETRPIVELMWLQAGDPELSCRSTVSAFQRDAESPGKVRGHQRVSGCKRRSPSGGLVEDFPGQSLLLPFHFPNAGFHRSPPSIKESFPLGRMTPQLLRPRGNKLRLFQDPGPALHRAPNEPTFKIKVDPDKSPLLVHSDQDLDLYGTVVKQEKSYSPPTPPPTSSFLPSLSSSSSSSSSFTPLQTSQKWRSSSSFSSGPLPSFSSSFLCSSFSSSSLHPPPSSSSPLHPLPSSLCSLSSLSPAGGRKGRVCCGVCGKSFYDKGTLKIHYNAVHLKIKHRCTVAGCSMVFSSLRSRNRHSANPNPRLHTGASRSGGGGAGGGVRPETLTHDQKRRREEETSAWRQEEEEEEESHGASVQHGCQDSSHHRASPPPSLLPLLVPAAEKRSCRHQLGSPGPGLDPGPGRPESGDPTPKKKPRKSSTPVKIERGTVEEEEAEEDLVQG